MDMNKIEIGKISAAFGIKGELKLLHYSGEHERIEDIEELFLFIGENEKKYDVISMRITNKGPIIKLSGVDDRNSADLLVGAKVFVDSDNLMPLEEDSYYIRNIVGMKVVDKDENCIGIVSDYIDAPSNPLLQINAEDGGNDFLLPFVDSFVKTIDEKKGVISIEIPEGIREINKATK